MLAPTDLTGIVLAGGKSLRMGTDKAFLELDGKLFIAHILETVQPCTEDIFVVSDNQKEVSTPVCHIPKPSLTLSLLATPPF